MPRLSITSRLLGAALAAGFIVSYAGPLAPAAAMSSRGTAVAEPPKRLVVTGGSSVYDWPTFHRGAQRWGLAANSTLSVANAGKLGVAWATDLYGAALDSPVVAYDGGLRETLAYIGTERGNVFAVNVATGGIVWSAWLGGPVRSTPVVASGAVWAQTWNSPRIVKLNASTGAVECATAPPMQIEGSPLVVTPPGGVQMLLVATEDDKSQAGQVLAVSTANCKREWTWGRWKTRSGSWDPVGYGTDANGRPLVLLGSADPDSAVYALNVLTGHEAWRFAPAIPARDFDFGSGITVSLPGTNGLADGAAYAVNKNGILYAIDLTTGAQLWRYDYAQALGVADGDISTPALDGSDLVVGYHVGIMSVNARTGALNWTSGDPAKIKVVSSPAIAGAPGSEVVAYADLAGDFDVASLLNGRLLYHYQTSGYITASPAVTDGNILVASSDGFLYDFAAGGGNDTALPAAGVSSPAGSSVVANPGGSLKVSGAASDSASGVARVEVAVQSGGARGLWWNGVTRTWVAAPVTSAARLASPGAGSTGWSLFFPVPATGGTYQVIAYAAGQSGQSQITAAHAFFVVKAAPGTPTLTVSPGFAGPGAKVSVTGSGFPGSEQISIALPGDTLTVVTATSTGRIPSTVITIPAAWPFGPASLTATGRTSGRKATAAITVTNNWDQLGYLPGHAGYEPNDPVLYNLITPGHGIFLDRAWQFGSGAAISTAPAVDGEVAYEGNAQGHVVAVDVHNGADRWTFKLASGAAITGSPGFYPPSRLVIVGAADGTVDAISARTGALAWAATVGGTVNAPVLANGVVCVTTSAGTVEALSAATGARQWAVSLPAGTSAAPAVDAPGGTVMTADSSGDLRALSLATGKTLWTHATGGPISAAPMLTGKIAYAGSGHSVVAVSETTGTPLWSYATGGTVAATPALTTFATGGIPLLFAGSDDGTLYAINGTTGTLQWSLAHGQPIAGIATIDSVVVFDTTAGDVVAGRTYTSLKLWTVTTSPAGITAPPAIIDGAVYIGGGDGDLYAFTGYGQPPP